MQLDNLSKQVSFIKEIDKIKYIQRKTKLFNSDRPENDAEHSWHLAMMEERHLRGSSARSAQDSMVSHKSE